MKGKNECVEINIGHRSSDKIDYRFELTQVHSAQIKAEAIKHAMENIETDSVCLSPFEFVILYRKIKDYGQQGALILIYIFHSIIGPPSPLPQA